MIYPVLNILPNQSLVINIYDTEYAEFFINLLASFFNQYNEGWIDGYSQGMEDTLNNEEI